MRQCGLLSRNAIRQIHSDIVTVEALSRLQASELQSSNQCFDDESKREIPADYIEEQLIPAEKPARLSEDVREYNKQKNHFSKSTAEESDLGVRELESLLNDGSGAEGGSSIHHAINNRKSKSVASLDF